MNDFMTHFILCGFRQPPPAKPKFLAITSSVTERLIELLIISYPSAAPVFSQLSFSTLNDFRPTVASQTCIISVSLISQVESVGSVGNVFSNLRWGS